MRLTDRLLGWIALPIVVRAPVPSLIAPPLLSAVLTESRNELSTQELIESRERILSGIMAWRIDQCRRELQLPELDQRTIVRFPSGISPASLNPDNCHIHATTEAHEPR